MAIGKDGEENAASSIEPLFYTPREVASLLSLSIDMVYAMLRDEELPAIRLGSGKRQLWRIPRTDLEKKYGVMPHLGLVQPVANDDPASGDTQGNGRSAAEKAAHSSEPVLSSFTDADAPAGLINEPVNAELQDLRSSIKEIKETLNVVLEAKSTEASGSNRDLDATSAALRSAPQGQDVFQKVEELSPDLEQAFSQLVAWDIAPEDSRQLLLLAARHNDLLAMDRQALLKDAILEICNTLTFSDGIKLNPKPPGKVVALIGATGVGKTTTIAKLAAYFSIFQRKRVSLVSLDDYRIAAAEQLRTYAEIMGVDFTIVDKRIDYDQAITDRMHHDLILVDTAGRSPRHNKQISELKEIFSAMPPHEVHLVISASTKAHDLGPMLDNFQPLGYDHVIITKLDETHSLGGIYNIGRQCSLPVSFFTMGQSVPEDIQVADREFINNWVDQEILV